MAPKSKLLLKIAIGIFVTACICGVLVIRSTRFQIAYHDWQMQRAWDQTWTKPVYEKNGIAGYSLGQSHKRYEYHRKQLIDIGVVTDIEYQFQHIETPTRESRHFIKQLLQSCPNAIDWESPSPEAPKAMELTVWCYSQDAESWNRFIAARDVPDYESQFMDEKEKRRAKE